MSSAEFEDWQAFYQLEPFGEMRADIRFGSLIAAVLNSAGAGLVRRRKFVSPRDVLPDFEKLSETPRERSKRMLEMVRELNREMGGTENGRPVSGI